MCADNHTLVFISKRLDLVYLNDYARRAVSTSYSDGKLLGGAQLRLGIIRFELIFLCISYTFFLLSFPLAFA